MVHLGGEALGKRGDRRSKAAGKTFSSGALGERDSMGDQRLVEGGHLTVTYGRNVGFYCE